jgi:hypothetical protein
MQKCPNESSRISLLDKEFWLENLLSECPALQRCSIIELIVARSERISEIPSQLFALISPLKESIANLDRQLKSLDRRIYGLEPNLP